MDWIWGGRMYVEWCRRSEFFHDGGDVCGWETTG